MSKSKSTQVFKLTAGLMLLLTQLAACGQPNQNIPAPISSSGTNSNQSQNQTASANPTPANQPVFASATSKRTLSLDKLPANSGILPTGASASGGSSNGANIPMTAPSAAASAIPGMSDISSSVRYSSPYGGGYYPFTSGGDFNSYVPVQAEENIFAGSNSTELLDVHTQTILPMLKEWDAQARLVESRGNTAPGNAYNPSLEYVSIPALGNEQPMMMRPAWIFRYASTPRKETLTIYVMQKETRAYRVSWSEPNIDLTQVKVTVAKAQEIARQAIADTTEKPGYPVYPESAQYLNANSKIIYSVPSDLNWNVSLSQQGKQLSYNLNFSYREDIAKPGVPVAMPSSQPSGGFIITQVTESPLPSPTGSPTSNPNESPVPTVTPTPMPSPTGSTLPFPDCLPDYARYIYISGYVSIDAVSGKILNLNRPVRYDHYGYYTPNCFAPGTTAMPSPQPYSSTFPTAVPVPMATSDI